MVMENINLIDAKNVGYTKLLQLILEHNNDNDIEFDCAGTVAREIEQKINELEHEKHIALSAIIIGKWTRLHPNVDVRYTSAYVENLDGEYDVYTFFTDGDYQLETTYKGVPLGVKSIKHYLDLADKEQY